MNTIATANGLCFCAGPWRDSVRVPPRIVDRAHIPNRDCERLDDQRPAWVRRMNSHARVFGKYDR